MTTVCLLLPGYEQRPRETERDREGGGGRKLCNHCTVSARRSTHVTHMADPSGLCVQCPLAAAAVSKCGNGRHVIHQIRANDRRHRQT